MITKRWVFLRNGTTFFPGSTAPILIAPSNVNRVGLIVQAIEGKARIGAVGVTATTGVLVEGPTSLPAAARGTVLHFTPAPTSEVWAIGDGGPATLLVQQIEAP